MSIFETILDMYRRFFNPPSNEHYFLLGPRGVGKSQFLADYYKGAKIISLLDSGVYRRLSGRPEILREMLAAESKKVVVIDEIQKIPELLNEIHYLIEQKSPHQFILSGSSARKLRNQGSDLLASRAVVKNLFPFLPLELEKDFNLNESLKYGLLPVIFDSKNREEKLEAYIDLYLKEELKQEGLVKDLSAFSRFLEVMAFSHAEQINISTIARIAEVERKSVERYIELLVDTLIGHRLSVFERKPKREVVQHPKFYFFDSGVFNAIMPHEPLDAQGNAPQQDRAFEGFIFQNLNAYVHYHRKTKKEAEIYFWRTLRGEMEVDFVIYGSKGFHAIEVKNSQRFRPEFIKGLRAFKEEYPDCTTHLVYRGKERMRVEGVDVIPVEEFLMSLHPARSVAR